MNSKAFLLFQTPERKNVGQDPNCSTNGRSLPLSQIGHRSKARVLRYGLVLAGGTSVIALCLTTLFILNPVLDEPTSTRADALVVLASAPERFQEAERVMDMGLIPTVVYSVVPSDKINTAGECRPRSDYRVLCMSPDPVTTQGEAMALGDIARQEGWDSVAVMTFDAHVTRSKVHVTRCFDGDVKMMAMNRPVVGPALRFREVRHEIAGLMKATLGRGCADTLPDWAQRPVDILKSTR